MHVNVTYTIPLDKAHLVNEFVRKLVGSYSVLTPTPKRKRGHLVNAFREAISMWPKNTITDTEARKLMADLGGSEFTGYDYIKKMSTAGFVKETVKYKKFALPPKGNRSKILKWNTTMGTL